jgi:hypothetical protein
MKPVLLNRCRQKTPRSGSLIQPGATPRENKTVNKPPP